MTERAIRVTLWIEALLSVLAVAAAFLGWWVEATMLGILIGVIGALFVAFTWPERR